jgi:hypothetical protein
MRPTSSVSYARRVSVRTDPVMIGRLNDADEVIAPLRSEERLHAASRLLDHLPDLLGALSGLHHAALPVPSR